MKVVFYEKETETKVVVNKVKFIYLDCPLKVKQSRRYIVTTENEEVLYYPYVKYDLYMVEP